VAPMTVEEALPRFKGVRRRMEVFHEAGGITFVDDFAHHPTAIRETIAAARSRWPGRFLRVLFEPRSNTSVTNRFQAEIAAAFSAANEVWLGPIHRQDFIPAAERLDRSQIVATLHNSGIAAYAADDVGDIVEHLRNCASAGDVVLILSNGAFGGIYNRLREAFHGTP